MAANFVRHVAVAAVALLGVLTLGMNVAFAPNRSAVRNEASAIGALRAINSAQSTYAAVCGSHGYVSSVDELEAPPRGVSTGFISPDLIGRTARAGYVLTMTRDARSVTVADKARTCNNTEAISSYFVLAVPAPPGEGRSYATDATGRIFFRPDGASIEPGMSGASLLQ